jgi:hypothetical protein
MKEFSIYSAIKKSANENRILYVNKGSLLFFIEMADRKRSGVAVQC